MRQGMNNTKKIVKLLLLLSLTACGAEAKLYRAIPYYCSTTIYCPGSKDPKADITITQAQNNQLNLCMYQYGQYGIQVQGNEVILTAPRIFQNCQIVNELDDDAKCADYYHEYLEQQHPVCEINN